MFETLSISGREGFAGQYQTITIAIERYGHVLRKRIACSGKRERLIFDMQHEFPILHVPYIRYSLHYVL